MQLAAGDKLDWYWAHPAAALQALRDPKLAAQLGVNLTHEIGLTVMEAQQFREEHGIADAPPPAAEPLPNDAGKREAEIAELRTKSVTGRLTAAEDARYNQLLEARLAVETAEENSTKPAATNQPDEYQRLVEKAVSGTLSPEESSRRDRLLEARLVESGAITHEDLQAEQQQQEQG